VRVNPINPSQSLEKLLIKKKNSVDQTRNELSIKTKKHVNCRENKVMGLIRLLKQVCLFSLTTNLHSSFIFPFVLFIRMFYVNHVTFSQNRSDGDSGFLFPWDNYYNSVRKCATHFSSSFVYLSHIVSIFVLMLSWEALLMWRLV
jgi:hypothetical protein